MRTGPRGVNAAVCAGAGLAVASTGMETANRWKVLGGVFIPKPLEPVTLISALFELRLESGLD